MHSFRMIKPWSSIGLRSMCDCKLAQILTNQHLVQTRSGQKLRLESRLQYDGSSKALSASTVDAVIQEAISNRNLDQIPIDQDWGSQHFEVTIPEIDDKVKAVCAVTPHLRMTKFQLELPSITIDTVDPYANTAEGINWFARHTLACQHIDPSQAVSRVDKCLAMTYVDQWRTEFGRTSFGQAVKAIDDRRFNKIVLATDSHLLIQHVSFWCSSPYYQTAARLMDKFPFLYRLAFGLAIGGLGPGLVWAICSQAIMLRFYFNLTNQDSDLGPATAPLAAPGWPAFIRYWLEVALMTGILLGIYATAIYHGASPDPARPYRNTIIWGASFYGLMQLQKE